MKKTVIVTGGSGFLGSCVVKQLLDDINTYNFRVISPRSKTFDLTQRKHVNNLFDILQPDVIIHLAAKVGGIGANKENPGSFFYDNIMMGLNLVDASKEYNIEKFIHVGTVCSYPKHCKVPFVEDDLWNGFPEETNAPYGIAKKSIITMLEGYKQQYGLNSMVLLPVNLYGPGDNFDENTSHVIPAIINKIHKAQVLGEKEIVCWGDGSATREFLYVEDAAKAICKAAISDINDPTPINLGGMGEISIDKLVRIVAEHMGFSGNIEWDRSKPNGQPRRCLSKYKCKRMLEWEAETSFVEGIRNTISWYKTQYL